MAMIDDLEGAYQRMMQMPLIMWCAEKRVKLEQEVALPPKGILTAEQAAPSSSAAPAKEQIDPELAAAMKAMA